jgi:glycosyltransferase involved in cell wall biosynthesis
MRIVHYYPRALIGDGGMTGAVRHLSVALSEAGADAVIAYDEGPQPPSGGPVRWAPVRHIGPSRERLPLPAQLEPALRGADLVVLNSAWVAHNVVAARVASKLGVAYVLAPRGAYEEQIFNRRRPIKRLWWAALEGPLVRRARAMHLFFDAERHIPERLGFSGAVIVAPNGVEAPHDIEWDGGSGGYVLWMGRFDAEHKGIDLLVRGVGSLPVSARPQLRLHGPDSRNGGKLAIRELVRELGLDPWVSVRDAVYGREKWKTLAAAVGFAYPSRWEGFGNSVAEAASIGVPVVVTPYYLGRFLAERDAAILVEASTHGVAVGLQAVAEPGAGAIGRNGRKVVEEHITWERVGAAWLTQARDLV